MVAPPKAPASPHRLPRPRAPVAPPPEEAEAAEALEGRVEQLDRERLTLIQRLVTASESATQAQTFQALHQVGIRFLGNVRVAYDTRQFPDAPEAMALLANCIRLLEQQRSLT